MTVLEGLDTSSYQGPVNWLAAREANKRFGIPKATEGLKVQDVNFPASWQALELLSMSRIAYHFFYDFLDGIEQSDYIHEYVRDHGHFRYRDALAVDVEEVSVSNARICIQRLREFIRHSWEQIDKPVWIYTNADTWITLLGNPTDPVFEACPLWLAHQGLVLPSLAPWPNGPSIVQYSTAGHSPGVNGTVDLDRFYGSEAQLVKIMSTVPHV